MENFVFHTPTKFYFGRDTHLKAGELLKGAGAKRVLLYYGGGSILKTGLYGQLTAALEAAGVAYVPLGGVKPNPDVEFCRETVAFIQKNKLDYILAVGGGSVIDSAKMAALAVGSGADPWDLSTGAAEPKGRLPLGVVLTIAATGSEGSDSAVLTNEALGWKKGLSSPYNRPDFAILNPELTYTLPPYQTAAGITDIMMHTCERYVSLNGPDLLLDGMAEELHTFYREMEKLGVSRAKYLIGSGNGLRMNPWLQRIFEERFGLPMQIPVHKEEAAYGAALWALTAAGVYSSVGEAQQLISYAGE